MDLEHEKAKLNHHRAKLILQDAEQFFATQKLSNVKFTHHTGFLVDSFQEFAAQADLVMLGSLGKESTAPNTFRLLGFLRYDWTWGRSC